MSQPGGTKCSHHGMWATVRPDRHTGPNKVHGHTCDTELRSTHRTCLVSDQCPITPNQSLENGSAYEVRVTGRTLAASQDFETLQGKPGVLLFGQLEAKPDVLRIFGTAAGASGFRSAKSVLK